MEVNWPQVRQVFLNDRVNGYKPDRSCLNKIARYIPDVQFLGFGRYYQFHWYLLIQSKIFPYSIEPLGTRGTIPLTYLIEGIKKNLSADIKYLAPGKPL